MHVVAVSTGVHSGHVLLRGMITLHVLTFDVGLLGHYVPYVPSTMSHMFLRTPARRKHRRGGKGGGAPAVPRAPAVSDAVGAPHRPGARGVWLAKMRTYRFPNAKRGFSATWF